MSKIRSTIQLSRLVLKVLFGNKFIYFMLAALGIIGFFLFINYVASNDQPFDKVNALIMLMFIPLSVLTVYMGMTLIPYEKDNRTIESIFSMPGSRYKIWLYKIIAMLFSLSFFALLFEIIIFYTVTDISFIGMYWHSMPVMYFIGGMTVYFSVKTKSSNAAGMVMGVFLLLNFMFFEPLHQTPYFIYFNPYLKPQEIDPNLWAKYTVQNHIGLICLGTLFFYLGLNKLLQRERIV